MQNAETVLGLLRERGRRGLPMKGLYRQLFNPQLYLLAYGRIYSNKGAMTPGPDAETADGMTMGKIEAIIDALRHERYRFKPVRRHYSQRRTGSSGRWVCHRGKAGRRSRPPTVGGVLRAAVLRSLPLLPARPGLPHRVARGGDYLDGTTWFIERDVSQCLQASSHCLSAAEGGVEQGAFGLWGQIRRPFRRPLRMWRACSSPRLTRCNTV